MSGTEAEAKMRFEIIDEIQKSQSIKQKEIALQALDKALRTGGFSGPDIVQTKTGQSFTDWEPKNFSEQRDYFCTALGYLTQFANRGYKSGY